MEGQKTLLKNASIVVRINPPGAPTVWELFSWVQKWHTSNANTEEWDYQQWEST